MARNNSRGDFTLKPSHAHRSATPAVVKGVKGSATPAGTGKPDPNYKPPASVKK